MVRLFGGAVAVLAMAGMLAGCGSGASSAVDQAQSTGSVSAGTSPSSNPSPSSTHDVSNLPACAAVWRVNAVLPLAYAGCRQGSVEVRADRLGCESGQRIVRYDNHWYAVQGGRIHHSEGLNKDSQYLHSVRVCRG